MNLHAWWIAAIVAAFAAPARAQDPHVPPSSNPDWKYSMDFYFWLTNLEGDLDSRGLQVHVDADWNDLLDKLESTFALRFEAWKRDQFAATFDMSWLSLEDDTEFASGQGDVEVNFGFTEIGIAGRSRHGDGYLDFVGGLRWTRFESGLSEPGGRDEENATNYFDPYIGVRAGFLATPWLHLSARFDVGGFGIGTELTGNFVLDLDFRVSETATVGVGWRTMAVEIEEEDRRFDLLLSGPTLAVAVGF